MLYKTYYEQVIKTLQKVMESQSDKIEQAADLFTKAIMQDGMIYVFGCGHSHIVAEDVFYRAGGLVPISAMLDSALMLHDGAAKSSVMERISGIAAPLYAQHNITEKDVLVVVSTSGVNAVPIEMAQIAQGKGVPLVAITSSAYFEDDGWQGKHLHECADVWLDNCVPHGDASVSIGESGLKTGPISTISSCMIIQSVVAQTTENLWQADVAPPLYVSGNLPDARNGDNNKKMASRYRGRIRQL